MTSNRTPRRLRLPKTTLLSLASELTPLVSSSVLFFMLVGLLPTSEYGLFITVAASAMIVTPFARAGAGIVLLRDLGAQRADNASWNDALNTTLITTMITVAAWALVGSWVVPELPVVASILLFWQQLVPMAVADLVTAYLFGKNDISTSLVSRITFAVWRILGLAMFWLLDTSSLTVLGAVLLATGLAGAFQNVIRLHPRFGITTRLAIPDRATITRGLPDSVSAATGSVLDSVDKPILTRAGFVDDTARYGVAMRLVGLAGVSTLALLRPFDQETFRAGAESVTRTVQVMIKAAKRTFPTSLLAAGVLWLLAGYVPNVLPSDYAESADIIKWGVWMMPMRALSFPFGNVLTAAGHRITRLVITAIAAGGNVVANLLLIPKYTWKAAVGTTLAAELFMAISTMACCWWLVRREANSVRSTTGPASSDR